MRMWARRLVLVLGAVAVAVIAVPPLIYAHHRWEVRKTWPEIEARWDALRRKYPPDDGNDSARQLQALAAPLGLDLTVHPPSDSARSRRWSGSPLAPPAYKEIGRFSAAAQKTAGDVIPEPPAAVLDFLQAHRGDIDRLVTHLADAPAPRWASRLGDPNAPTVLAYDAYATLHLLTTEALWQEHRGAHAQAQRALEAHWRMGRALADRPESGARSLSDSYVSILAELLPKMDQLPPVWSRRVAEVDPHAVQQENLDILMLEMDAVWRVEPLPASSRWVIDIAIRNHAVAARRTAADFAKHAPCALEVETLKHRLYRRRGFLASRLAATYPDVSGYFGIADKNVVDLELAGKVLDLKARRDAAGGAWPPVVPGIESSVCEGARWSYGVADDGRMTLTCSRGFDGQPPPSFTSAGRPLH